MTRVILERLIAARILLAILAVVAIILVSAMVPALAQEEQPNLPSRNNCTEGEVIDNSTPEDARRKFEAAGYSNVVITSKGCDNFWHATAVKDGMPVNVVLAPDGRVVTEGN